MKEFFALAACLGVVVYARADTYDVVIHGGRIVDGSGNPAYFADVAVKEGKVVKIGTINEPATTYIDATHLVVAPGFIDVHTHADDVAEHPRAENFVRMGVTTIVVGNCGASALDIGQLFKDIEHAGVSVNVASLIGHNDVREKAMGGTFDRPPTDAEMARMKALVDQAMKDGAVGFSTGLIYLPGTFAKTDEIVELARVIAPYGGIYTSHMRHEDARIFQALDEVFQVAREAHVRAEVSHIKLSGENAWGQADKVLAYIEKARAAGLDITQDQYAYTASSTTLRQLIPDEAFDGGETNFFKYISDPDRKARLAGEMKATLKNRHRQDYAYAVIADYPHDKSLNGLDLVRAAKKLHDSDSLDAQIESIFEIQTNGSGSGVFHGMDEPDLQKFMQHPNTMIACDSGIRIFGEGVPHPRGYGNNARVLGRYVRELHVLRLEDAIRKMTSLPANTFQFAHRGELRVGNWADIVVFDPARVLDMATYDDPHHYPIGIPDVLVNGVLVIKDGEHTDARPGQALRHGVD
jgi:N-acyl-D-amino-acid deacylase